MKHNSSKGVHWFYHGHLGLIVPVQVSTLKASFLFFIWFPYRKRDKVIVVFLFNFLPPNGVDYFASIQVGNG